MHEIAAWQEIQDEEEAVLEAEDAFSQEFYPPVEVTDEDDDYILPPMDTDEENVSYELQDGTTLFYPPVTDDEDDGFLPPLDDDEDAPRSLYVDEDEAETAKRVLWDKYLKGRQEADEQSLPITGVSCAANRTANWYRSSCCSFSARFC